MANLALGKPPAQLAQQLSVAVNPGNAEACPETSQPLQSRLHEVAEVTSLHEGP